MNLINSLYLGFFTIMIFSTVLWLFVYYSNLDKIKKDPKTRDFKDITFLVPAYNEEDVVGETIKNILSLDYPEDKVKVIAINDGSEDGTLEELEKFNDSIEIIDKENTGKADSMNVALEQVDTELVASMDADSYPKEDYLKSMVGYFEDKEIYGVTPALKLSRDSTIAEKIQWAEYIYQIFLRKVFALFNVQYVMPGPGSVYRTEFLKDTGGWDESTFTEDMEVAFRLMNSDHKIENSTNAEVMTDPPTCFKDLFKQRTRWYRGYMQNCAKYSGMIGRPSGGTLGMFLIPLNAVWIGMLLFLLLHTGYGLMEIVYGWANTYTLLGYFPFDFSLSIQQLHFFHIFILFFFSMGLGTIFLSLYSANEPVDITEKKTNYLSFFILYPYLFAMFWIATFFDLLKGERQW